MSRRVAQHCIDNTWTDGEKWDKFCAGLRSEVRLEVYKYVVAISEQVASIALRVEMELQGAMMLPGNISSSCRQGVTVPMEDGNIEGKTVYSGNMTCVERLVLNVLSMVVVRESTKINEDSIQ